ncbi:MAG: hypothetical protein ABI835_15145 [Chloroflexota bacterium]
MPIGRFKTLGLRFRDFGRSRLARYGTTADASIARAEAPEPSGSMPPDVPIGEPRLSASPLPDVQPVQFGTPSQVSAPAPAEKEGGIPDDLLRILELHENRETSRRAPADITPASDKPSAPQRPVIRPSPGSQPPSVRRRAASIDEITPASRAARESAPEPILRMEAEDAEDTEVYDVYESSDQADESFEDDLPGGVPRLDELPLNWQSVDSAERTQLTPTFRPTRANPPEAPADIPVSRTTASESSAQRSALPAPEQPTAPSDDADEPTIPSTRQPRLYRARISESRTADSDAGEPNVFRPMENEVTPRPEPPSNDDDSAPDMLATELNTTAPRVSRAVSDDTPPSDLPPEVNNAVIPSAPTQVMHRPTEAASTPTPKIDTPTRKPRAGAVQRQVTPAQEDAPAPERPEAANTPEITRLNISGFATDVDGEPDMPSASPISDVPIADGDASVPPAAPTQTSPQASSSSSEPTRVNISRAEARSNKAANASSVMREVLTSNSPSAAPLDAPSTPESDPPQPTDFTPNAPVSVQPSTTSDPGYPSSIAREVMPSSFARSAPADPGSPPSLARNISAQAPDDFSVPESDEPSGNVGSAPASRQAVQMPDIQTPSQSRPASAPPASTPPASTPSGSTPSASVQRAAAPPEAVMVPDSSDTPSNDVSPQASAPAALLRQFSAQTQPGQNLSAAIVIMPGRIVQRQAQPAMSPSAQAPAYNSGTPNAASEVQPPNGATPNDTTNSATSNGMTNVTTPTIARSASPAADETDSAPAEANEMDLFDALVAIGAVKSRSSESASTGGSNGHSSAPVTRQSEPTRSAGTVPTIQPFSIQPTISREDAPAASSASSAPSAAPAGDPAAPAAPPQEGGQKTEEQHLEQLARDVYRVLRNKLRIEQERRVDK